MGADADACAGVKTAKPFQRKLISRSDVKARSAVPELKKRHVECLTCLPTERLATACWAFIVVKRTGLEAAPVLVSRPLQAANMKSCQQDIHRLVLHFVDWRKSHRVAPQQSLKRVPLQRILVALRRNPKIDQFEVTGH
jgi:hypothetical protein